MMKYSNSSLVSYTKLSPNHSGKRTHSIDRISPHCVVGQCSVERLGEIFLPKSRKASCQYGIGSDGRIGMYVEEENRSWCTSNKSNDERAITIECASDTTEPYTMNAKVYQSLINLCVDICKRNGKKKLLWFNDKAKTLAYEPKSDEMVITVHRWFAKKSCPGDWLYSRLGELANRVTEALNSNASLLDKKPDKESSKLVGATSKDKSLSGSYRVTSKTGLNLRYQPGKIEKDNTVLVIPANSIVRNYGYYTEVNGLKWLYVEYRGQVGFAHSSYLRKI